MDTCARVRVRVDEPYAVHVRRTPCVHGDSVRGASLPSTSEGRWNRWMQVAASSGAERAYLDLGAPRANPQGTYMQKGVFLRRAAPGAETSKE